MANPDGAGDRGPLTVVPPGARVRLKTPEIPDAEVLTVQVRAGGYVTYEVAWWYDGDRMTAWAEAWEIDPDPPARMSVGFRPPE